MMNFSILKQTLPKRALPKQTLSDRWTVILILLLALAVNGCKTSDPEPSATMSLKMSIDGVEWEAKEFLVRIEASDPVDDEHLWINAQDPGLADPSKKLDLYIYDYKKTGTSTVDRSKNNRYENGDITFIDISRGSFIGYDGPITYVLTKVEGNHYQGTFSGTLCAYSCLTSVQPISVQGSFDVRIGIQTE